MEKNFMTTEKQLSPIDPFGLRQVDFSQRIPEETEMFSRKEARTYIESCDYPESVDDLLLAWEVKQKFNHIGLENMTILDAMCGPGRLGRELLNLGTRHVVFHDGDWIMTQHAQAKAQEIIKPGQNIHSLTVPVDRIPLPANYFDLVVCHNSTHQLSSLEKLSKAMERFLYITKPGRFVMVADYQRNTTPEFLEALEDRLKETKPEIIPLLIPTFMAAFSKEEWRQVLESTPGISSFLITDATFPEDLTPEMWEKVGVDPVKGHVMDFSAISLRVLAQK
jgi:ubiquinone/menaquinone biosynthesis C-methylase UbiE